MHHELPEPSAEHHSPVSSSNLNLGMVTLKGKIALVKTTFTDQVGKVGAASLQGMSSFLSQ